ncbi:hypothetical protein BH23VER1_BH23VER1_13710 [soil metagenome]
MNAIPPTSHRVPLHTNDESNRQIRQKTADRVVQYRHASREAITRRLRELD